MTRRPPPLPPASTCAPDRPCPADPRAGSPASQSENPDRMRCGSRRFPAAMRPRRRDPTTCASLARCTTCSSIGRDTPTSRKRRVVHAREHRHADHERPRPADRRRGLARGFGRRLHHRAAAGGVDVDHPRAGGDRRLHRAGHGVGNVVELQVEEHAIAVLVSSRTMAGPAAVKSCLPILNPPTAPRSASASSTALAADSTSRATRIGFTRARLCGGVGVERADQIA